MSMHMRVVLVVFDIMFHMIICVTLQFVRVNLHRVTCLTLYFSLCFSITYIRFRFIMISLLYITFCSHFNLFVVLHVSYLFSIPVGILFSIRLN